MSDSKGDSSEYYATYADDGRIVKLRSDILKQPSLPSVLDGVTVSELKAALDLDQDTLSYIIQALGIDEETFQTAVSCDPACLVTDLLSLFCSMSNTGAALTVWRNSRSNIHSLRAHLNACRADTGLLASLSGLMHISDAVVTCRSLMGYSKDATAIEHSMTSPSPIPAECHSHERP